MDLTTRGFHDIVLVMLGQWEMGDPEGCCCSVFAALLQQNQAMLQQNQTLLQQKCILE